MTGDCHAGICGSPGVRFPRATRPHALLEQLSESADREPDPDEHQPGNPHPTNRAERRSKSRSNRKKS